MVRGQNASGALRELGLVFLGTRGQWADLIAVFSYQVDGYREDGDRVVL